jgi:flagellar basal-body rod modification protein FlgD
MSLSVNNNTSSNGVDTGSLNAASSGSESDRFLKLLVTQMQNQDPLNPLDNAQVTSQMAQISTVTGLEKLNTTVGGLNGQFMQLQAMQGASLVGHDVAVEGNTLRQNGAAGDGGFELGSKADKVKIEITSPDGTVVGTINETGVDAGRHRFDWQVPPSLQGTDLSFKITASAGGTDIKAMTLQHEKISAVSTFNNQLALELGNGDRVAYDAIWAFL